MIRFILFFAFYCFTWFHHFLRMGAVDAWYLWLWLLSTKASAFEAKFPSTLVVCRDQFWFCNLLETSLVVNFSLYWISRFLLQPVWIIISYKSQLHITRFYVWAKYANVRTKHNHSRFKDASSVNLCITTSSLEQREHSSILHSWSQSFFSSVKATGWTQRL